MIPLPRLHPASEPREPRLPAGRSAERPPSGRRDRVRQPCGSSFRRHGLVAAPRADARRAACACALLSALHCLAAAGAAAQQSPAPGSYVLELTMRDRWMHEGQHPGFVAFEETRTPMRLGLEFSAFDDRGRYLELRVGNRETRLSLDSTNRTGSIHIDEPPLDISRYEDAREQVEHRRRRLDGPGALLALPPARFWEVPFVVPSEPLRAGVTWSDTLSFVAAAEGMSERLEGVWRSRVVGDTLMHGRSLPIVETTAELRYRARAGDLAAALLSGSEVDRRAARAELADIVQRLGRPAPDSLVSSLLRPFLDALSSGAAMPWPDLDGRRTDIHAYMSGFHGVTRVPVFVLDENLPSDIGDAVLAPFSRIARQQWEARPLREGGVLVTFAPTIVWEDFVRLTLGWRAYERRAPNEAPSGYAGGGSFTLLRTPDGWRIAAVAMWIT